MDETNSLIEQRRAKLAALRETGVDPFVNKFTPSETNASARAHYAEDRPVQLAGRVSAQRDMGKSLFFDIKDQSGRIQVYAQKNVIGEDAFKTLKQVDLGDFVGVNGTMFTTRMGEISVKLESFVILAKALRPPPEKWHGLVDTETRYRQRYLDLMANDDVKDVFLKRSAIIHEIREFFHERNYVEVETPAMQAIPGGAAAQPFVTRHNALGCDFYLRIALELYHKRLLVGGIDRLFEIGKNFRNEGLSRRHNPEFTMLEAYQAFGDYESMMETVQSLICRVAQTVFPERALKVPRIRHRETQRAILQALVYCWTRVGRFIEANGKNDTLDTSAAKSLLEELISLREKFTATHAEKPHWEIARLALDEFAPLFERTREVLKDWSDPDHPEGKDFWIRIVESHVSEIKKLTTEEIIDLTPDWRRARYKDLVCEKAGADWFDVSPEERRRRAIEDLKLAGDIAEGYEDFEVTGAVFEKLVEPTLIQPTFVTHLPKELVPLAKLSPDDPSTVEVFECCINGQEIAPGYTEQNDPIQQREALEHQAGGEQQKLDEDFLVALEHGMPPAGGIGIGIDRLCMMLLGQENIRDVILFPQLKPLQK